MNECGLSFKSKGSLNRHKNNFHSSESKEYSNSCNFFSCYKQFKTKSSLRSHLLIHSGEKPFVCSFRKCNKKFGLKEVLIKHINRHFGRKNIQFKRNSGQKTQILDSSISFYTIEMSAEKVLRLLLV